MKRLFTLLLAVSLFSSTASATTYLIDPAHSSVTFTVRHLVGRVAGQFTKFDGSFDYDAANPKSWKAMANIDPASVNTGIEKRDNHLRGEDFFDVKKNPKMSFISTGITDVKGNKAKLHGQLTMHGVTKPVDLDLEVTGTMKNPMGAGERAGAVATGKINRKDYGITNKMDAGGMIGEDVTITLNIEAVSK